MHLLSLRLLPGSDLEARSSNQHMGTHHAVDQLLEIARRRSLQPCYTHPDLLCRQGIGEVLGTKEALRWLCSSTFNSQLENFQRRFFDTDFRR
jgi:hypothetical protein